MKKLVNYLVMGLLSLALSLSSYAKTVVVIDAGHGGKDPGAIGSKLRLQEKNVTLAISKELKAFLDADPNFKAVMTRSTDKFIQLPERTEIARKHKANYLVSIHADTSPVSHTMKGASVWVLSNQRASDEMGKWLEDHEKQSELLGGAGSVLSNNNERYLNQAVLDLQFSHSQRAGYELGRAVISKLSSVISLAKSAPQHASLSVLRSPDIPSILVETGFLSNSVEEEKLSNASYRRKIAKAIYDGLVAFRAKKGKTEIANTSKAKDVKEAKEEKEKKVEPTKENKKAAKKEDKKEKAQAEKNLEEKKALNTSKENRETKSYYTVKKGDTLSEIAQRYNTTAKKLIELNQLKDSRIDVGNKIRVK